MFGFRAKKLRDICRENYEISDIDSRKNYYWILVSSRRITRGADFAKCHKFTKQFANRFLDKLGMTKLEFREQNFLRKIKMAERKTKF